jgi:HD-like signal output (HDOD) protein
MDDRHQRILNVIKETDALPTIPAVALNVLHLTGDPTTSVEKLAEAIECDPALTAKTLRIANSAYYSGSTPVVSVPQALVRIGVRGAKMLALSFSLLGACGAIGAPGFDFRAFWHRSLTTSVAARRIAERSVRQHTEEAFVAALLAEVGCPVLAKAFPREYGLLQKSYKVNRHDLVDLEQRLIGIGHPQISQMVLSKWHLPKQLCDAVGAHHDLQGLDREDPAMTTATVVHTASELADVIIRGTTQNRITHLAAAFKSYFSFGPKHVEKLLRDLTPEVQSVGEMFDVPLPPADQMHDVAKEQMLSLALTKAGDEMSDDEARQVVEQHTAMADVAE